MEHWCITLWFGPYSIFVIAQDYDAGLGPEGQEIFILLDREYAHGWDRSWAAIFFHCKILAKGDAFESTHVFNGSLLFVIAL